MEASLGHAKGDRGQAITDAKTRIQEPANHLMMLIEVVLTCGFDLRGIRIAARVVLEGDRRSRVALAEAA